jgi:hypothetical protein
MQQLSAVKMPIGTDGSEWGGGGMKAGGEKRDGVS